MEQWKAIPWYEGLYEVSDAGRVRSVERYVRQGGGAGYLRHYPSTVRSLHTDPNGYMRVTLKRNGGSYNHLVHHLVLEAFVGPRPARKECRHLNGQRGDNRLANLQWGTSSENSHDVVRHGHHPNADKTHCKRGHEFTPENTILRADQARACRACNRERANAWYLTNRKTGQIDNKDKTHCKRGHEFTPENTYQRKDGRQCKTCTQEASKARYAAKKNTGNANYDRTHCPQGHPYDEENTYRPPGTNNRMCKTCVRNRSREYQRRRRMKERGGG
mgnify:CR=1 FL=1